MRIRTQLSVFATVTSTTLVLLVPLLIWSVIDFNDAKNDYLLANAIKVNFFERSAIRDQYFLRHENRLVVEWDKSKSTADFLLRQADGLVHSDTDTYNLDNLLRSIEDTAVIFHRIAIINNPVNSTNNSSKIYLELYKRLSSQLLLKAGEVSDSVIALETSAARRIEQSYQRLLITLGIFAALLSASAIVASLYLTRIIRNRVLTLHEGASLIAKGNLQYQIPSEGYDEFSELARSFNVMTARLTDEIKSHIQLEESIKSSELRWKFALEGAGDGVWDWNPKTNEVIFSDRWKEIIGYAKDEFPNAVAAWDEHLHPDERDSVWASIKEYFESKKKNYSNEFRFRCKDGSWKWILSRGMVIKRDVDGSPLRMIGTHTDISKRKEYERQLELFSTLFNLTSDCVYLISPSKDFKFVFVNDATCRHYEMSREELLQKRIPDWDKNFKTQADLDDLWEVIKVKKGLVLETKHHVASGREVPVEVSGNYLLYRGEEYIAGFFHDISERKQNEEVLRLHSAILENLAEGVYFIRQSDGVIVFTNPQFEHMFGYEPVELLGKHVSIVNAPTEKSAEVTVTEIMSELARMGKWKGEVQNIRKDGTAFWCQANVTKLEHPEYGPVLVAVHEDITERKLAELALQESENRFRIMADSAPVLIWVAGLDKLCYWFNKGWLDFTGRSFEQEMGNGWAEGVHSEDFARCLEIYVSNFDQRKPFRMEYRLKHHTGEYRWIDDHGMPRFDSVGTFVGYIGSCVDIADRKKTEIELINNNRFFNNLARISPVGIFRTDAEGSCVYVSERWQEIAGMSQDEALGYGWGKAIHPDDRKMVSQAWYESAQSHKNFLLEYRFQQPNGVISWVQGEAAAEFDNIGNVVGYVGTVTDVSMRKIAESDLLIAAIAFESQEGMSVTDANGAILRVNQAFTDITGYSAEEVIGKSSSILKSGRHDVDFYKAIWETISSTGAWEGEIWNRRKNGEVHPEHLTITAVKNADGIVTNYVSTLTDITLTKAAEDEIKHLAFYDPLTRLPNRRLLLDRLRQSLASIERSGRKGALLFIDLDNFKTLNDTLGHDIGDLLLQQVGKRLESCVREGDTVARLGGDEFVIMLADLSKNSLEAAEQTEFVGNKILSTLNQTYQLASHEYHNTPSIGATLFSDNSQSIDELMKQADIAMYQSKKAGRNTLHFFDPKMQESINTRATLERELRNALEKQQFQLYFQLQVDGIQADGTHRPIGAEVLIRWIHPVHGLISPAQFIPLAEETGLILPIGQWVLDTACAQIKRWEQHDITKGFVLAVNVSAKQFRQTGFVDQVKAIVKHHAINASLLKLELTESLLLENIEDTIFTMSELRDFGVQFSLDDFGTGYSSLQYLKRLPLDQLKIDQSFVRDITFDSSDSAIVRTIIAMARSLNLNYIAEGVEKEEQKQLLLNMGCTHYQGFLYGKPMPIAQFEALLQKS